MTNAEKYLKPDMRVAMWKDYNQTGQKCKSIWQWLDQEVKPTLTEDERVILRNLKEYKFIGRGKNKRIIAGELYISKYSSKDYDFDDTEWIFFEPYEHLFRGINSGEEYSIKELLKGE